MNLAFISASQVPSRAANSIQVMKVCQAYAQLGHRVRLFVPGSRTATWEDLALHYGLVQPFDIEWVPAAPALRRYDLAWNALRQARRAGAQVVYTWMLQAAFLAERRGLPVLLELHDRVTGRIGPFLFRRLLGSRGPKRFLPITLALCRALERDFARPFAAHEVVIAPDGVDLERYAGLPDAAAARRELGLPEGPTVGYSGHLYAGRGMDLLLGLARSHPETRFLWVGGRPEDVTGWQARLAQAGLDNVRLPGFVPNARLPMFQAAADILVMPYERTVATSSGGNTADFCSPMKMFEYMAAGRAILSSDLPVLHEVLNPGNAFFCPPDDPLAWQAALSALLADPARRRTLGEQARQDVARYSWQARAAACLEGLV